MSREVDPEIRLMAANVSDCTWQRPAIDVRDAPGS